MNPPVSRLHGSAIILMMATITVISLVGAALVSISSTSIQSQLNTGNALRAYYLAESGLRFAELDTGPGPFYTVWTDENGNLRLTVDDPPPAPPQPIPATGFRIRRTGCKLESIGLVRTDSVFEAGQRLVVRSFNGMPCWNFDEPGSGSEGNVFSEPCGANVATFQGSGGEWRVCDGISGGSVALTGMGDYLETNFPPFCEIGDGAAFTVRFQARPDGMGSGVVLGVSDGFNRFSAGIDGNGDWYWAYGNRTGGYLPAEPGIWQRVTFLYDPAMNEVRFQVVSCPTGVRQEITAYDGNAVIPGPLEASMLFLGAENRNGIPLDFWEGGIDRLEIVNAVEIPDSPELFCPGAAAEAFFPLDWDARDRSGPLQEGNGHDAVAWGGTLEAADRWNCPQGGYAFEGDGDHLSVPDADGLDLLDGGTLAVWIYPQSFLPFSGLIHKGDQPSLADAAYTLQFGGPDPTIAAAENQLFFGLRDILGSVASVESSVALSPEEWVHVAVTWDPFDGAELVLFLDGVRVSDASLAGFGGIRNSVGGLNFGAQFPDSLALNNYPFHGRMDDVLIYDTPLSEEAIARLAANRPAGEAP